MATVDELLTKANELIEEKNYQGVIDLLTDEVLEECKSDALYAVKALIFYELNEYDLCKQTAEKGLVLNPANAYAYFNIGSVYGIRGQYEKAVEEYDKAIACDRIISAFHYCLGLSYYHLKQYKKAIDSFAEAINIDPKYSQAFNDMGNAHWALEQYKEAIDAYNEAIKIAPTFSYPYNGLGNAYKELKQYEKAIDAYNEAIKIDPTLSYPYNGLGNVYLELKQYPKAIEAYKEAIKNDPNPSNPYNGLGNLYQELKQYDKAIEAYKEAIKNDSAFSYPHNGLGIAYKNLQQYEQAIEAYSDAINIDPQYPHPYYNRASTNFTIGQYENAINDFSKYIELTKDRTNYNISLAEDKIIEIGKLLNIEGYRNFYNLVSEIKSLLRYNDDCVTHYTTMTVAKALVLDKESTLRLSEAAYLNDTSEGKELFNYLSLSAPLTNSQDKTQITFIKKPFIGSFVAKSKHNDLTLWRMYGKEDREEAKGCSITIRREEFINKLKDSLKTYKKNDALKADGEFIFYRVAYRKEDKVKPFTIPSGEPSDEEKLNILMTQLVEAVTDFLIEHANNEDNKQTLFEKLNEIAYLFKTYDYQYEHEIRLVLNGTGFPTIVDAKFTPPKVYIELVNIMPVITTITLGPKVERSEEWITAFHYGLKNEGYSADIIKSRLPFK